jgi:hypothetical protein
MRRFRRTEGPRRQKQSRTRVRKLMVFLYRSPNGHVIYARFRILPVGTPHVVAYRGSAGVSGGNRHDWRCLARSTARPAPARCDAAECRRCHGRRSSRAVTRNRTKSPRCIQAWPPSSPQLSDQPPSGPPGQHFITAVGAQATMPGRTERAMLFPR